MVVEARVDAFEHFRIVKQQGRLLSRGEDLAATGSLARACGILFPQARIAFPVVRVLSRPIGRGSHGDFGSVLDFIILKSTQLPAPGEPVTADIFRLEVDRQTLKTTRRHEGQYLFRSDLTGEDLAEIWRCCSNLVRIKKLPRPQRRPRTAARLSPAQ